MFLEAWNSGQRLLKALSDCDSEEVLKQYQILLQEKPKAYSMIEILEKRLSSANESKFLKALATGDINEARNILGMNEQIKDKRFDFDLSDDEIDRRLNNIFV